MNARTPLALLAAFALGYAAHHLWPFARPAAAARVPAPKSSIANSPAASAPRSTASLADLTRIPDRYARDQSLRAHFAALARENPDRARTALADLPGVQLRQLALAGLAEGWLENDFAAASAWIKSLPVGPDRDQTLPPLLRAWGQRDPASAQLFLRDFPRGNQRDILLAQLAQGWISLDPMAATTWAAALPEKNTREKILADAFTQWARQNPAAALARAAELKVSTSSIRTLLENFAGQDLEAAKASLAASPLNADFEAVSAVARTWSRRDPDGLPAWFATTALNREDRLRVLEEVIGPVLETNPEIGLALLRDAPPSGLTSNLYNLAAETLATLDLAQARAWVETIPRPAEKAKAIESLASHWSREDPAAASRWMMQLPPELRAAALPQVLEHWSEYDALGAADFVLTQLPPEQQIDAAKQVMGKWAREEPATVANWIPAFKDEKVRTTLVNQVVKSWADQNPAAAAQWIRDLPAADPRRAAAIEPYYDALLPKEPRRALEWIQQMGATNDPTTQHRAGYAALNWSYESPAEARRWLEQTTTIDPAIKRDYLEQMAAQANTQK